MPGSAFYPCPTVRQFWAGLWTSTPPHRSLWRASCLSPVFDFIFWASVSSCRIQEWLLYRDQFQTMQTTPKTGARSAHPLTPFPSTLKLAHSCWAFLSFSDVTIFREHSAHTHTHTIISGFIFLLSKGRAGLCVFLACICGHTQPQGFVSLTSSYVMWWCWALDSFPQGPVSKSPWIALGLCMCI